MLFNFIGDTLDSIFNGVKFFGFICAIGLSAIVLSKIVEGVKFMVGLAVLFCFYYTLFM